MKNIFNILNIIMFNNYSIFLNKGAKGWKCLNEALTLQLHGCSPTDMDKYTFL